MEFQLVHALGSIEHHVGSTPLALIALRALQRRPPAQGAPSVQLAFRVAPQAVADRAAAKPKAKAYLTHPFGYRSISARYGCTAARRCWALTLDRPSAASAQPDRVEESEFFAFTASRHRRSGHGHGVLFRGTAGSSIRKIEPCPSVDSTH